MSGGSARPRQDQVEALTRGVRLPLEPLAEEHLEVIGEGLRQAFEDVRQQVPGTADTGDEPEVTALMQAQLNGPMAAGSLWGELVLWVGRGSESVSFDGRHLEKRPDLAIMLSGAERRFPLVAEAKILDAASSKTIGLYCRKGIRRFVDGEYAWGNGEAFMIGYVRDGSSIDATLTPFLSAAAGSHPDPYAVEALPVHVDADGCELARTRHGRKFVYAGQPPPNSPGPISLWHLWLE